MRESEDRPLFLSTLPAERSERRLALGALVVSVAIFIAAAPFAKVPLAKVPAFIPVYEAALVVNDLITAILLFGQFRIMRARALMVLASGYLFTAFITVAHALTFPDLFAPGGLLGAGPQSTAWLYMFWHGGFPLFAIAYALLRNDDRPTARARVPLAVASSIGAVTVAVGALTMLATTGQTLLPAIMRGNQYTPAMLTVVWSTWAFSLVALVVLWRRRPHSVLDLWLMVVMCAWLGDIGLSAVLNAGRFDLGFYTGRIYGLFASGFVLVVLLLENGRLYARLAEAHDGERRERQRADAANLAKSEFLSRMSHELRTPLNAILGFGQLLEMEPADGRDRESVQHILKGGRHLLELINEVLDIARIEAGHLTLSVEPVHVRDAIAQVVDLARPLAAARSIALHADGSAVADRHVHADSQRLRQVLLNLVSNGIKYNREGGALSVTCAEAAPGWLRITVTDTGPGISPAMQARLFTPFDRLGAETGSVEGTGLGLALSKKLVEAMHGAIGVESAEGRGSRFWVELQEASGPADAVRANDVRAVDAAPVDQAGTLLYIEDNPSNLQLVERVIRYRPGIRLISSADGLRGLELARQHRPDAILLDLHLPGLSGADVLSAVRADPALRETPVIMLSADATAGQIERLRAAGADDYLTKPLDVRQFLAIVDRFITRGE